MELIVKNKMPKRSKHPDKDIEEAIIFAESKGWRYQKAGSSAHAWGRLLCPENSRAGCILSIWSTPRSSIIHARQIRQRIKQCLHKT